RYEQTRGDEHERARGLDHLHGYERAMRPSPPQPDRDVCIAIHDAAPRGPAVTARDREAAESAGHEERADAEGRDVDERPHAWVDREAGADDRDERSECRVIEHD